MSLSRANENVEKLGSVFQKPGVFRLYVREEDGTERDLGLVSRQIEISPSKEHGNILVVPIDGERSNRIYYLDWMLFTETENGVEFALDLGKGEPLDPARICFERVGG